MDPVKQIRKIIHIDLNAFYASVEQRDNPPLRGKPVVVGGDPYGRGVVATASYEARAFGIHSAQSCKVARKLCPDAIFLRPRFEVYRAVSQQIQAIYRKYTHLVEPLALDEAFLDITFLVEKNGSATQVAREIKQEIFAETGLTVSAGVSFNKLLVLCN
jgi:DNA polymerase IV